MYTTDASRWQAVQRRDRAASSSFVYAVISTKIYCRPGCPSRIARRANVLFYDTPQQAASAGYRPCLRCKPDYTSTSKVADPIATGGIAVVLPPDSQTLREATVRKACDYIRDTHGQAKFAEVAKHVGLSTRYLYGLFKTVLGVTPAKYAANLFRDPNVQLSGTAATAEAEAEAEALTVQHAPIQSSRGKSNETAWDTLGWTALIDMDAVEINSMQGHFVMDRRSVDHSTFSYNSPLTTNNSWPSPRLFDFDHSGGSTAFPQQYASSGHTT